MSLDQVPAIVGSAGRQGLAVTRGLGANGVPTIVLHWDDNDLGAASRYATEAIAVPAPEVDGTAFVEHLLSLADRYPGALLIPTTDAAVKDVASSKEELERHFIVDCPNWEIAERYVDKRYTYELAAELGVPIPRTVVPACSDELEAYGREVDYPCLIKPRESHLWAARLGGKMTVVNSLEEMHAAYARASEAELEVMVQELIPGPDTHGVNYNAYRSADGILADCTARKIRQGPPGFGLPRVVLSTDVPQVVEPGRALLEGLGFEGFACTEFKFDPRDGEYKLLEVNGRHNVSSMLSIRCGLNFPLISYRYRVAKEKPPVVRQQTGIYWVDEWLDLAFSRRHLRDVREWRRFLRPWARSHVFSVFDPQDLGPFRIVARQIGRDAIRVLRKSAAGSG